MKPKGSCQFVLVACEQWDGVACNCWKLKQTLPLTQSWCVFLRLSNLHCFQIVDGHSGLQLHSFERATCFTCFMPIHVKVLVDHDGPSAAKLQEQINVAAVVLGQTCVASSGMQQILGSGVEIDMLSLCSSAVRSIGRLQTHKHWLRQQMARCH
jgi:hypothetical protein